MRTSDRLTPTPSSEGIPATALAARLVSEPLRRWRREQLVAAGFDEVTAQRIARDATVDIHAVVVSAEGRSSVEGGRHGR